MKNSHFRPAQRLDNSVPKVTNAPQNKKIETYKLVFDLLKHLTTLSSGSVLLLITLYEKVFGLSSPGYQLVLAFSGFFLSICCSVVAMILLAFSASDGILEGGENHVFAWTATIGWVFFVAGILFTMLAALPKLI